MFDAELYLKLYPEIETCGYFSIRGAKRHYLKYGQSENRRCRHIISNDNLNLKQNLSDDVNQIQNFKIDSINISPALIHFKSRFIKTIESINKNQQYKIITIDLFFGIYTDDDVESVLKTLQQQKNVGIIWGGEDINTQHNNVAAFTLSEIKQLPVYHFAISDCISNTLSLENLTYIKIPNFSLLDTDIFKPSAITDIKKNIIYIYNGQYQHERPDVYGGHIYNKIYDRIKNTNTFNNICVIFSADICITHENMVSEIYDKCIIVLRLTKHDGNANTAQECEALGVPIIFNFSDYGLKWASEEDVWQHINKIYT